MPVYYRKRPTEIPEPSEAGHSDDHDDKDLFLTDPELFQDQLPQPYRMIDKVLSRLVDSAWELISQREASRIAKGPKKKNAVLHPAEVKLPKKPNCLSCSRDGKYVFLGHSHGLTVISASLICVAVWEDESLEIISLHSTCLGELTYLLSTVDDMGVSRIFAFSPDLIYLIKSINETDDISHRKVCTKFELSEGGNFAAAAMEGNGTSWLEVYQFPTETWLKELEVIQAAAQNQVAPSPGEGEIKFSPIGLIMKIGPPRSLSGSSLKTPFDLSQSTEDGNVIGSGEHHMISGGQWECQEAVFKSAYRTFLCESKCKPEDTRSQCTFHFLLAGGLRLFPGETETQSGMPIAICVWWSGSHNLFQYTLSKTGKYKPDAETKPSVVWPNGNHIVCSATSRCTVYVSLGLVDGTVTIWDRCLGIPWSVLGIPGNSIISGMLFLDPPAEPQERLVSQDLFQTEVCVLVPFKNGMHHLVTSKRGRDSHVTSITERTTGHGTLPATVWTGHVRQKLVLFIYRNGDMVLQDTNNGTDVCRLAMPSSHCIGPQWKPVCALDSTQWTLIVRGDRSTCADGPSENEDSDSSLFFFQLPGSSVPEEPHRPLSGAEGAERGRSCGRLEETFNLYLQERLVSLRERKKVTAESWSRLPELAQNLGFHSAPTVRHLRSTQ